MASKKGVVMYYDILEQLEDFTDEQFGKITRAIIKYDQTGETTDFDDPTLKVAFKILKPTLDRNKQEYQEKCEKNRQNVLKRWEKEDTNEYDGMQSYDLNTNDTDKDKDIDKDIDKDNDTDIEKKENIKEKKSKKFVPPTLNEVKEYAKEKNRIDLAEKFYDYFTTGNWIDSKGNKVKNWKQKFITWADKNPITFNKPLTTAQDYFRQKNKEYVEENRPYLERDDTRPF